MEKLSRRKDLRGLIIRLRYEIEQSFYKLAKCLYAVHKDQLYSKWGFASFKDYMEKEIKLSVRTGERLISVYKMLESKIKDEGLKKKMLKLGWTALHELKPVIKDEKTAEEWLGKAEQLSVEKLKSEVRTKIGKEWKTTYRLNLAFSEEQAHNVQNAMDLAKKMAKSDKPSNLIDLICTSFVGQNADSVSEKMVCNLLQSLEVNLGIRMFAMIPNGEIIYGKDLVTIEE